MKKYGLIVVLAVAVVSGTVAVVLAHRWLTAQAKQTPAAAKQVVETKRIVVAARDVGVGGLLGADSLMLAEWPATTVPRGAYETMEELEGRVAVTRITAGQPILNAELAAPGSGAGLVATIAPGHRAMAIRVDEVVGVGGFVLPNTYVDIISVTGMGMQEKKVKTLLTKIKVLAIAQETFTEEGKPKLVKTVTLQLTPRQAEQLALKTLEGTIHLVLRNPSDPDEPPPPEPQPVKVVKKARAEAPPPPPPPPPVAVVEAPPPPPPPPPQVVEPQVKEVKPEPFTVEVIRGSKPVEKVEFADSDSDRRISTPLARP
jgi:pilus assembly protein CpaB